jgi:hypothetical protein
LNQSYTNLEIVVVDNASSDSTVEILRSFKNLTLIRNKRNYGVCFARNRVIKDSKADFIMTMDSDVVLDKDFIKEIIHTAINSNDPKLGMLGGVVLDMKEPNKIDSLGIYLTKFYRFYDYGKGKIWNRNIHPNQYVLGPCACAGIYRRDMLEEIREGEDSYFDEDLFYLVEDFDVALRAHNRGWKFKFVPTAICYHYRHGTGFGRKYIQYLSFRNRYILICKDFKRDGLRKVPYLILSFLFYDLPRFFYLIFSNFKYTKLAIKEVMKIGKRRLKV